MNGDSADRDPTGGTGESDDGDRRTARVTLAWDDGRTETVEVGADPVLDAAEAAGIGLPFGCRTGACGTCTGRVVAGSGRAGDREGSDGGSGDDPVEHVRPPRALKDRHLDSGYVLTCIARPCGDCRIRVGSDVAGELVENPWK